MKTFSDIKVKCPYCCWTFSYDIGNFDCHEFDEVYCESFKCKKLFFIKAEQTTTFEIYKLEKVVIEGIINPDNLDFKLEIDRRKE